MTKPLRHSKMWALVHSGRKRNVVTTCEGMLCIYPSYQDAKDSCTKNEKLIPVMVSIERIQSGSCPPLI
jgi:hypothetical protein